MKIVKEFILREIAGEVVLIPTGETTQEFNGMITLSESAKLIWENLECVESLDEMVEKLLLEYDVDEEIAKKESIEFISSLLSAGLIECSKEDQTW